MTVNHKEFKSSILDLRKLSQFEELDTFCMLHALHDVVPEDNWLIGSNRIMQFIPKYYVDAVYNILADHIGRDEDSTFGTDELEEDMARKAYTADFETTVDEEDCRVWAAATCEIGNPNNIERGNTIEWFLNWCKNHTKTNIYFHNLAFDGAFIMDYLERHGWEWIKERQDAKSKTYTTVISDANQVYCIDLFFTPSEDVKIMDSLKIIPLSIKQMAIAYNLPILKGSIDYESYREIGHELTSEEIAYLDNDVKIAAMVLETFLEQGLTKMTAGSNALSYYKDIIGGKRGFRASFPVLDEEQDTFIRKAYRGGFTYVNPKYQNKKIGRGIVFDVNSLYPSVMNSCDGQRLPYGRPIWFYGKPKDLGSASPYNLWVGQVTCSFRIRENHIPCIQLKGNYRFNQTEYLERSDGDVTFTITNVDWDLITQQYHIYNLRWHGGYYFKSASFMFKKYIEHWIGIKNQATIDGNAGMRQIAKLMLNSLYGKFATRTKIYSRRPMLIDDVLRYVDLEPEERDPVYLPVGVFVTAYARYKTITSAQSVYDRFIYADTDSLHLVGTEIPENLDVDSVRLGAWKHESTFTKAKFLRAKCYLEYEEGKEDPTVHVAGMPVNCHKYVNIDNFNIGAEYDGKLYVRRVNGGIVLVDGKMQIREK